MAFGSLPEVNGFTVPANVGWKSSDIVAIDNDHLAAEVELKDGAGFSAENGLYGLTNLFVRGTEECSIVGSLSFTQAVSRVTFLTNGGKLTFATANVQSGVEAGFDVSGPGTLTVNDLEPLTGTISVRDGASFVLSLKGSPCVTRSFSGDGTVVVAEGELYVPAVTLADFTGNFHVTGGRLVLDEELPGRVTVSGTGSVVYGTDPLVVTDRVRTESGLTVAAGETMLVYGDGLTAATALTLAGGTVKFVRGATIASSVTVTADSFATGSDRMTCGVFSGDLTGALGTLYVDNARISLGGTAVAGCRLCVGSSSSGTLTIPEECSVTNEIAVRPDSSVLTAGDISFPGKINNGGYVEMTDGDVFLCELEVGWKADGSFRQTGGNLTLENLLMPYAGDSFKTGVLFFGGGTTRITGITAMGSIGGQQTQFTVDGGEVTSDGSFQFGFNNYETVYANFLSGSYTTTRFYPASRAFNGFLYVYFDGGTLKLNGNGNTVFGSPEVGYLAPNSVRIGPKGGTIDTCGKTGNTIDVPLLATPGNGVLSVALDAPITGLSCAPIIKIATPNGYTGSGAAAVAEYDSATGTMTGICMTTPGYDYTGARVRIYTNGVMMSELSNPVLGAVGSGSFTKAGEGDLTLNAVNTYLGGTIVNGGTLVAGVDGAIPDGPLTIAGGVLDLNGTTTDITSLTCDLAMPYGGISGLSSATLPTTVVVRNGQLAGADGKYAYKLLALPDGYPGGAPDLVLEGNVDPGWRLVISKGFLQLKKDLGLMLMVR